MTIFFLISQTPIIHRVLSLIKEKKMRDLTIATTPVTFNVSDCDGAYKSTLKHYSSRDINPLSKEGIRRAFFADEESM